MEIDINALETYDRLARDGAQRAGKSLSVMTGIDTHTEVTNVSLIAQSDLVQSFTDDQYIGVQTGVTGALHGSALLMFDETAKDSVVKRLLGGSGNLEQSGVTELGNIMLSGFIDGWADYLDAAIDIEPPTYVEGSGEAVCPPIPDNAEEYVFVFRSHIEAITDPINFRIILLPESDSFRRLVKAGGGQTIPLEKLSVFTEMTKQGAGMAADNIAMLTGLEASVDVSELTFVPVSDVPPKVGDAHYIGTVMEFTGLPSGYLVILFDEPSARKVSQALIPESEANESGWNDMEQSALQELGNIMTSGFIDGWANVLQTSIDHSPPEFVNDMGSAIVSPIAGELAQAQEYAFVLDSTLQVGDGEIACELYAFPHREQLTQALDQLLIERADQTEADFESLL